MRLKAYVTIAIVVAVLVAATSVLAADPAVKCQTSKIKEAGKYGVCRLKAEAKRVKKGVPRDTTKCEAKFTKKWRRIEEKAGGGTCPSEADEAVIDDKITDHANDIGTFLDNNPVPMACTLPASGQTTAFGSDTDGDVQAGDSLAFVDNGDGTITDLNTGLMWEKKDASGGIHSWYHTYTWCSDVGPADLNCDNGAQPMDGTMVRDFLDTLNRDQFAGYDDWRIPNVRELRSIADYETTDPAVSPAFHQSCSGCSDVTLTTCSCTGSVEYYSSTTQQGMATYVWTVGFLYGHSGVSIKTVPLAVRAVRGGL